MDPPYQPPGPQQAFPQAMPPPDGPPNYQRSASSQLQLPAPRQLLHYADTYRQASSQSHPRRRSSSASLPAPHQLVVPIPAQPQHHQSHHYQQDHLPALNTSHSPRTGAYANEGVASSATDAQPTQLILTSVSNVDEVEGYQYQYALAHASLHDDARLTRCQVSTLYSSLSVLDRRPITPPPCVRLSMIDMTTGKEINYNEIDHATFVLNVDLWNAEGTREVNLVRSSAAALSSTASSITSQGFDCHNSAEASYGMHVLPSGRDASYSRQLAPQYQSEPAAQESYHGGIQTYRSGGSYTPPPQHKQQYHDYGPEQAIPLQSNGRHSRAASTSDGGHGPESGIISRASVNGGQPQGMFTRNLIGSVAVSAFNLCDTEDKRGIWFVLQDLSVRTEGNFR
ncbi:hypothetical protein NHJ13734_009879 [Beauveria thailandica]